MDSLCVCWRGMAGSGKKTLLHESLKKVSDMRGLPFNIQMRKTGGAGGGIDVIEAGATDEGADPDESTTGQLTIETSLVHIGLDIARMSMQDKQFLRPILMKLGQGSQVMAGEQGRGSRILVLYHAHLLSSESILLVQACLEMNEGDLSIWFTSELPVPQRIRDWFVEVSVSGKDYTFDTFSKTLGGVSANWPTIFKGVIDKWLLSGVPKIGDVKEVKAYVYEMLMRNLRWVEATHFLLDTILTHPSISDSQRKAAISALADCEATGGGYTIPSYRIPIIWESLFLQLRSIFTNSESDVAVSSKRVSKQRKRIVEKSSGQMDSV
jgi:hypothetical protein